MKQDTRAAAPMTTEQLHSRFRAAMTLPLCPQEEQRLRAALQALMLQLLSRRDLMRNPELQGMLLACRLRLRKLQLSLAAAEEEGAFAPLRCDLGLLARELCAACDVLLRPMGRQLRFAGPQEPVFAACEPRAVTGLLTELICNAARHSPGEVIALSLTAKRASCLLPPNACVITVTSEGHIDLPRLHAAAKQADTGTAAMLRTARLHRAALLWLSQNGHAVASLRLPLGPAVSALPQWYPPDRKELICDSCSPVYVGLAQVCGVSNEGCFFRADEV